MDIIDRYEVSVQGIYSSESSVVSGAQNSKAQCSGKEIIYQFLNFRQKNVGGAAKQNIRVLCGVSYIFRLYKKRINWTN